MRKLATLLLAAAFCLGASAAVAQVGVSGSATVGGGKTSASGTARTGADLKGSRASGSVRGSATVKQGRGSLGTTGQGGANVNIR